MSSTEFAQRPLLIVSLLYSIGGFFTLTTHHRGADRQQPQDADRDRDRKQVAIGSTSGIGSGQESAGGKGQRIGGAEIAGLAGIGGNASGDSPIGPSPSPLPG